MTQQSVIGIVPARGGSKGIPGKNLQRVGGISLVGRAVLSLVEVVGEAGTFVSTDDPEIAFQARTHGAGVIDRPTEISGDSASSEIAVLHALDVLAEQGRHPEVLVMLQCTSPFIEPKEVSSAIDLVSSGKFDSVLSATRWHAFLWRHDTSGAAIGVNHDERAQRQRRQDMEPEFRETGAFYVMRTDGLRRTKSRFFGRIGIVETNMPPYEIDVPEDLVVARALAAGIPAPPSASLTHIKALIMDFDGVHTDDRVLVLPDGTEAVTCSRRDGMGLEMLRKAGIRLLILSKERNPIVHRRAEKLGIPCLNAIDDKETALDTWLREHGLTWREIAFIGNDINDVPCMRRAGISFCPADGHESAKNAASGSVLSLNGGNGAIREACDSILARRILEPRGHFVEE
jgi:YrbI family 3-deoxy-D-manno-octulosonate 8-phosphate phosphatase